jgi:hypothetical protein
LTSHDFGTITPSTGRFTKVEVDSSLGGFSWPKGIAIDTKTQHVIIMTSHVHNRFYTFDPRTSGWRRLPSEIRDLPLVGLTYLPADDCLYALERRAGQSALEKIHRFNVSGASLGSVELDPATPLGRTAPGSFQLHGISDKLVVLLPPFADEDDGAPNLDSGSNRILVVDPVSGAVAEPLAARTEGTASG